MKCGENAHEQLWSQLRLCDKQADEDCPACFRVPRGNGSVINIENSKKLLCNFFIANVYYHLLREN